MNSDEDKFYIKIVALDVIYNFVVENFMNWNCIGSKNIILSVQILKFKIYNYKKVIVIDRIYNFI